MPLLHSLYTWFAFLSNSSHHYSSSFPIGRSSNPFDSSTISAGLNHVFPTHPSFCHPLHSSACQCCPESNSLRKPMSCQAFLLTPHSRRAPCVPKKSHMTFPHPRDDSW